MKKINITIVDLNNDLKPLIFNNLLKKYYDKSYIDDNIKGGNLETKYWYFKDENVEFNLLDNPCNDLETYFKLLNQCNSCLVVVDANKYKSKDLDDYYYLCYTLGINNIILLISNLENLPNHDAITRFYEIEHYLTKKLKKIGLKKLNIIPYSKLEIEEYTEWFKRYDLLSTLKDIEYDSQIDESNKFMIISNSFNINKYGVINGVVGNGIITKNDVICIKPDNTIVNVKKIEKNHEEIEKAYPQDYIGILIDGQNIKKDSIALNFNSTIKKTERLICRVIILKDKLEIGNTLTMYYNQTKIGCKLDCIHKNLRITISNRETLPKFITKHKVGIISIDLDGEIYTEPYISKESYNKHGRVLFLDENKNLAAIGVIKLLK